MRNELRAAGVTQPIGTNSHDPSIESHMDYVAVHDEFLPSPRAVPVMINETAALSLQEMDELYASSLELDGVYYFLWRGELNPSDWEQALALLGGQR